MTAHNILIPTANPEKPTLETARLVSCKHSCALGILYSRPQWLVRTGIILYNYIYIYKDSFGIIFESGGKPHNKLIIQQYIIM